MASVQFYLDLRWTRIPGSRLLCFLENFLVMSALPSAGTKDTWISHKLMASVQFYLDLHWTRMPGFRLLCFLEDFHVESALPSAGTKYTVILEIFVSD